MKKKELKQMSVADFFGTAPVKRETAAVVKKAEPEKPKPSNTNSHSRPLSVSPEKKKNGEDKKKVSATKSRDIEEDEDDFKPTKKASKSQDNGIKKEELTPKKNKVPRNRDEDDDEEEEDFSPKKKVPKSREGEREDKKSSSKSRDGEREDKKTSSKSREDKEKEFKAPKKPSKSRDDDDEEDFNPKKKTPRKRDDVTPAKDAAAVPGESPKTQTPKQKENYMKYLAKMSMKPKNLGSKEIPEGAPNCLKDLAFVISGVLDSLERDDCKDLVVKYGGRVTGAVSRKTNYLIIGDEAGESKVRKAVEYNIPQISEDDLLDMIRKSNPAGKSQDSGLQSIDSEEFKIDDDEENGNYDADKSLFGTPTTPNRGTRSSPRKPEPSKGTRSSPRKLEPSKPIKQESPKKRKRSPEIPEKKLNTERVSEPKPKVLKMEKEESVKHQSTSGPAPSTSTIVTGEAELMWVDKYKPKTLKNVVGQASETSNAKKLLRWLQNWFKYHGSSQDKPKAAWPGLKDPEGKTFKAALLSGPPGIGKTTSAHLVIKECGYDYFELNASDTRNKKGLHENVADALSSKTLAFGRINDDKARKHVLIMDEVDGMSGNEDRGGVQELIGLIKTSRVPIICICNDRNHPKIRSLANYCFDLRFNKPTFEQLKAFVMSICFKEKIKLPQEKIQQLIISTDNDVRQILHQLELYKEGKSEQAFNPRKDLRFGPWDVIRKVFLKSEHAKMSIHDKNGLFFQDYSIGPLFVQENYARWIPAAAGGNRYKHMDILAKTASSLADGDLVDNVIRRNQNWGLLPVQAVFASYLPGEYMSSNQMGGTEFPHWLGKNSNRNKRHRLLQSLHSHLQLHISGSLEALNMDYLPYLRRTLTKPLVEGDHESAAKIMEEYTLIRDDIESISDLSIWPGTRDPMERVDSKVKAAFTRQVNKEVLPYSNAKPTKGRGRAAANPEDDLEALLEEGEGGAVVEEEEEEESIEKDAMVKVKTRKAGPSKATSSGSSSGGKKGKKMDDSDEDEGDVRSSKSSKSKPKQPSKSRKGK